MALGASRWRIVRQLLVESLLLAAIGGAVGLALSYPGVQFFTNAAMEEAPSTMQFPMDRAVFAYLISLCVGSAAICSLVPARHASRTSLAPTLNDAGRGSVGSRHRRRWTGAFVVAQVTLALVLLSGAMLMIKSLVGLMQTDVGIETNGLSQMAINLGQRHDTPDRRLLFLNQLEERLAQRQGVEAVLASQAPLGGAFVRRVRIDGGAAVALDALPQVSVVGIGNRYFEVVGVPVIAGRSLTANEVRQASDRVVVNERFARMTFPDGIAVGQRILLVEPSTAPAESAGPLWAQQVRIDVRRVCLDRDAAGDMRSLRGHRLCGVTSNTGDRLTDRSRCRPATCLAGCSGHDTTATRHRARPGDGRGGRNRDRSAGDPGGDRRDQLPHDCGCSNRAGCGRHRGQCCTRTPRDAAQSDDGSPGRVTCGVPQRCWPPS
jgi:cell division protein FtsX